MPQHVVIIGNGIAGITTARYLRKTDSSARITVISSESDFFYSRTALMYIYMGHMTFEDTKPYEDFFWEKNRIERIRGYVRRVDPENNQLDFGNGDAMHYDKLVLATGSRSNKFGWPGQDLDGVQGLYGLQDLQRMEQNTRDVRRAVVVGGGLIGIEMSEMLHSRKIPTTFLVREDSYMDYLLPPEESAMVNREIQLHGIELRLGTELREILGDDSGQVNAVVTGSGERISAQFVGLTVGVKPNIDFLEGSGIETAKGILVNHRFETNIANVFAAGDCAEFRNPVSGQRPVEQLWYTGKIHGEILGRILGGNEEISYVKGVFYNSAKFFDIEYQTYGTITPNWDDTIESLYWEHPDGKRSVRINFSKESKAVVGFNLMGIRYRHDVCSHWIREDTPVTEVLENLAAANFDPEFFNRYEPSLREMYNRLHPESPVSPRKRRWYTRMVSEI